MRFFNPKIDWDEAWGQYEAHLRSIRDSLPGNARKLSSLSFHDSQIKAVAHLSKSAVEIMVEGSPFDFFEKKWLGRGTYTLSFSGAKKYWAPYTVVGAFWICEELRLSDIAAFDYEVRLSLNSSAASIRVQADDVFLTQGVCK